MRTRVEFDALGKLPTGWTWEQLQALAADPRQDIVDGPFGSNLKASEYVDEGVPIARLQNVDRNQFIGKNIRCVTWAKAAELVRHKFQPGDILLTKLGDPLGKACIAPPEIREGVIVADLVRVRPDLQRVDPKYLTYALNSPAVIRQLEHHTKGTTRPRVNLNVVRELPIPVAPRDQQGSVVAELEKQFSRLDQSVANLKRVKANLDRYVAATLAEAFAGRWAGNANDWLPVPLREVANVQLGQQRAPIHAADLNPIPYIRAANVTWRGIDVSDVKSMGFPNPARYRLAFGDILLAEASGSASEVGKPAVWRDEIPGACYQKTLIRVRCNPDCLSYQFAYYFFLHTCLSGQFARLAPGVGILHLTAERMLVWPTVTPPLRIQASIVAELDRRLSIVREVEAAVDANLKRAQALRQAVLARAFTGGD